VTWREIARRRAARLIDRLALCSGGCRQIPSRCTCEDLPPLP
jgi:hypothetical protein